MKKAEKLLNEYEASVVSQKKNIEWAKKKLAKFVAEGKEKGIKNFTQSLEIMEAGLKQTEKRIKEL